MSDVGGAPEGTRSVDRPERWPVQRSEVVFTGSKVIEVRREMVTAPASLPDFERDVVIHPGAVGVLALDEDDRVLLVRQYRHPVRHRLLEPPAGLLDTPGETYLDAAARELYEEAHVRASRWAVLVDFFSSPGMSNEGARVYLARGLTPVPEHERHAGEDEEADMDTTWLPLADVVDGILAGELHNPILCVGALAAWAARHGRGYDSLRLVDAPWSAREAMLEGQGGGGVPGGGPAARSTGPAS